MERYVDKLKELIPCIFDGISDTDNITEIRIRAEKCAYFVFCCGGLVRGRYFTRKAFDDAFLRLCGGNMYKHESTLLEGFFTDIFGGRCGVACNVIEVKGELKVTEISSINIRIPRSFRSAGRNLFEYLNNNGFNGGVIVFGKPRSGKTTVLKSLAGLIAESGRCVCIVDERREFSFNDYSESANMDILSGYPKWRGIEIALRTLSADIIICDELGASDKDERFRGLASSGVPLIASAHSAHIDMLLSKQWFNKSVSEGVFRYYLKLNDDYSQEVGVLCLS